VNPRVTH